MMDTVLNLGMSDDVVRGLLQYTGNPRFVWDSYRQFLHSFGVIVQGIDSVKYGLVKYLHLHC